MITGMAPRATAIAGHGVSFDELATLISMYGTTSAQIVIISSSTDNYNTQQQNESSITLWSGGDLTYNLF